MRKVAIVGAGMTPFAEHFARGIKDLLPIAFSECAASVDKGLHKSDLDAAWFGAMGCPVTHIENSCATGNDAVRNALFDLASEAADVALVIGADKLREVATKNMLWGWEAMTRDMAWDHPLVEAEVTSVGGSLPVNPSGGLKAKGHSPGATWVAHCVELFQQLRGEAASQVDGARIGLAHNIDGSTAVSAVTILEGPDANGH